MKRLVFLLLLVGGLDAMHSVFTGTGLMAQRVRTTAVFDGDTATRPKSGFYGVGVRSGNAYLVPPTGNNVRLANYSLFTGLTTNYLSKWNGSKFVNSAIYESGGNVGIGTGSPGYKLQVEGNSRMQNTTFFNGVLNGFVGPRSDWTGGTANNNFAIGSYQPYISFFTNNSVTESMRIDASGNVGIGTASPGAKFHLDFSSSSQNGLLVNNAENSSYFNLYQNGSVAFGVPNWPNATLLESVATGGLVLGSYSNKIIFQTGNRANHSVIDFNGNVGIGTASPQQKTHINTSLGGVPIGLYLTNDATNATLGRGVGVLFGGTGNTNLAQIEAQTLTASNNTGGLIFRTANGGTLTERIRIDQNGNVGIGGLSATDRLQVDVANVANTKLIKFSTSAGANNYGDISVQSAELRYSSPFGIGIAPNNTVSAFFATSGSVGIGTTSPEASAQLHISSTTRGVLLPRMTTAQINAISSPANGLMVYNTDLNKICVRESTTWRQVTTTAM